MEYAIEHATQGPSAGVGKLNTSDLPSGLVFGQRNLYYLRASPRTVIQMLLYLDPRHLDWMNEEGEDVLPLVMDLLRPKIMPKLQAEFALAREGGARTSRVEQLHTDEFKVAYFFRRVTSRHAVLLKDYVLYHPPARAAHPPARDPGPESDTPVSSPAPGPGPQLASNADGNGDSYVNAERDGDDELAALREAEAAETQPVPRPAGPRTSHPRAPVRVKQEEVEDDLGLGMLNSAGPSPDVELDPSRSGAGSGAGLEEGEGEVRAGPGPAPLPPGAPTDAGRDGPDVGPGEGEGPGPGDGGSGADVKPAVRVKYSGFGIFDKMLVVVVEPTRGTMERAPHLFADEFLRTDTQREDALGSLTASARGRSQSAAPGAAASRKRRLEQAWDEASAPRGQGGARELSATPYTAEERVRFRAEAEERERVRQASMRASMARRSESVRLPLFRGGSQTPSEMGWARTPTPVHDLAFPHYGGGAGGEPALRARSGSVIPVGQLAGRAASVHMPPPPTASASASSLDQSRSGRARYSRLSHSPSPTPGTGTADAGATPSPAFPRNGAQPEQGSPAPEPLPTLEEDSRAFELASQMLARPDADEDDARALEEEEE